MFKVDSWLNSTLVALLGLTGAPPISSTLLALRFVLTRTTAMLALALLLKTVYRTGVVF